MNELQVPLRRNVGLSLVALGAASGTLICCVLPAVMVALGAGAALGGLVTAVPQLVWLSANKGLVFGVAGAALALSGWTLWRARALPCPADAELAKTCARLRRLSIWTWFAAMMATALATMFAFVLPSLGLFA